MTRSPNSTDSITAALLTDEIGDSTGPKRVLIVSPDLWGPVRNGGIGTLYRNLALTLAAGGHEVDLLYTRGTYTDGNEPIQDWIDFYRKVGVNFVPLRAEGVRMATGPISSPSHPTYKVFTWLRQQNSYDVVHAPEFGGHLHYSLQARATLGYFSDTTFVLSPHSSGWWNLEGNAQVPRELAAALRKHREFECLRMADVVLSSSQHMVRWLDDHDLRHERTLVWPNAYHPERLPETIEERLTKVDGIAFTGRLEPRKGIHLFFAALKQVGPQLGSMRVAMMGKKTDQFDLDSHLKELRKLCPKLEIEVHTTLDADGAFAMLKSEKLLAVIPSVLDNSPLMVSECIEREIPFLASQAGGTSEIIHRDSRSKVVFEPSPHSLADKLMETVDNAWVVPPAVPPETVNQTWIAWHDSLEARTASPTELSEPDLSAPVTVCVVHHNRPAEMESALGSLVSQTVKPAEILIVDNGSTDEEALSYLQELSDAGALGSIPIRIFFEPNLYPGAARNLMAAEAKTELLLFADDDNIARPEMIETFLRAAHLRPESGAFTCLFDRFTNEALIAEESHLRRVLPAGNAGAVGIIENVFGDTNALVRRSAVDHVGGFHERWGVGREDHAFLLSIALSGAGLELVPEALFFYRMSESSIRLRHTSAHAGPSVAASIGAQYLEPDARFLAEFCLGMVLELRGLQSQKNSMERQSATLEQIRKRLAEDDVRLTRLAALMRNTPAGRDHTEVVVAEPPADPRGEEAEKDLIWLINRLDTSAARHIVRRFGGFGTLKDRWVPDGTNGDAADH